MSVTSPPSELAFGLGNASGTDFALPASVRLAIVLPTVRWSPMVRSIVGSLLGVASEEVAVLIGDNSENAEKRAFLHSIHQLNPNIHFVSHEKNIGSFGNFVFLHHWCRNVEFSAIMADDDCMSPDYHIEGYRVLLENPQASGASCGATLVDVGDGKKVDVTQKPMLGATPMERMQHWSATAARATMYDTSRRNTLDQAIEYHRQSPLNGITLLEDLWELSRLAHGEFLAKPGHGLYMHYPATRTIGGDETQRFYNLLCRDAGLQFPFVYFASLSTAVQCALFLLGRLSPIADPAHRNECAQHVFRQIFAQQYMPNVSGESSHEAVGMLFANSKPALDGFDRYCNVPNSAAVRFDQDMLDWFIEIIKVFETRNDDASLNMSTRFETFARHILDVGSAQAEVP